MATREQRDWARPDQREWLKKKKPKKYKKLFEKYGSGGLDEKVKPTTTPTEQPKGTIHLKEPIELNQPKPTGLDRLKPENLKAQADKLIGGGFLRGETESEKQLTGGLNRGLALGGIAAAGTAAISSFATRAAIQSGFAQQAKAIPGKIITYTGRNAAVAGRYASNAKTSGLTKTILQKAGFTNNAAINLATIVGSYPFAGFIKEEAIQQLTFSAERSLAAGDIEGAEKAVEEAAEQVDYQPWEKVLLAIPYANISKEVVDFLSGAVIAIDNLMRRISKKRGKIEFEGQSTGEEIAQRDLEQEEKFDKVSEERETRDIEEEKKFARLSEERVEREEEETEKYTKIEEDRVARDEEDKRVALVMQDVWRLRREGKFEEADELERSVL